MNYFDRYYIWNRSQIELREYAREGTSRTDINSSRAAILKTL